MSRLSTFSELLKYIVAQKKFWLIPIIIVVVILGALVLFTENSVLAPFIYSLF